LFIKKALLTVLPVFLLILSSCSDYPSSIGADLLRDDYIGISEINSTKDSLLRSADYFKLAQPLGGADRLLIGKAHGIEAGTLINFNLFFADSIDDDIKAGNIVIRSASVVLYKNYAWGGDTNKAFVNFHAYEVTNQWGSQTFTADSNLSYNLTDLASNIVADTTQVRFNLNTDVVLSWFKYAADTNNTRDNGIYIKPEEEGVILGYQALSSYVDSSQLPRMWVVFEKPGVYTDTVSKYPEGDLSLVAGPDRISSLPEEDIVVQAGQTLNSIVLFDLSSIPAHSIINSAELTLTVDTLNSITGTSFVNALYAVRLLDPANTDSVTNFSGLSRTDNKFQGDVTTLIQNIYSDIQSGKTNNGIVLRAYDQVNGVERYALKGFGAAEAEIGRAHV
jgi:hypothetical protein